jgi:hypothetical protein
LAGTLIATERDLFDGFIKFALDSFEESLKKLDELFFLKGRQNEF